MDENIKRPNLPPNSPVQPPIALIQPPNGPVQPLNDSIQPPSALIQPPVGPIQLTDEVHKLINKIAEGENLFNTEIEVSEASEKGDNYMGQLLRVQVSDNKQQKSQNFIVKNAPNHPVMRKMVPVEKLYMREIAAYKTILPALYKVQVKYSIPIEERFSYAKFFGCIEDLEKESIIMEDLSTTGFRMYNRKIPFDKQHLELVIRTLARFHATSFVLKKTHPKHFQELSNLAAKDLDFMENSEEFLIDAKSKCLDMIRDPEIRKKVHDSIGNLIQPWSEYVKPERTEPYNVICHGDCWINNFLFKYENDRVKEMKLIDLQIIRISSPITDLAYMIFSSTDAEMRASFYKSTLNLYYQTLDSSITRMGHKTSLLYPKHIFEDQVKSTMPLGLITGIMLVPMMLCDKENVPDMVAMTETPDPSMYEKIITQGCQNRIDGIANDFVAYGYI